MGDFSGQFRCRRTRSADRMKGGENQVEISTGVLATNM
jgi:hypothetical protein